MAKSYAHGSSVLCYRCWQMFQVASPLELMDDLCPDCDDVEHEAFNRDRVAYRILEEALG